MAEQQQAGGRRGEREGKTKSHHNAPYTPHLNDGVPSNCAMAAKPHALGAGGVRDEPYRKRGKQTSVTPTFRPLGPLNSSKRPVQAIFKGEFVTISVMTRRHCRKAAPAATACPTMDLTAFARIAKLVALLCFFLPWVAVSCSGTEILEATGWQLMTGDIEPSGPLASVEGERDPEPAPLVIAAFAVIALGLAASFLGKGKTAAAIVLGGALLGAGLSWYSLENMRAELTRELDKAENSDGGASLLSGRQRRQMARAVADAIEVEPQQGHGLTLAALAIAALLSGASLAGITISGPPRPVVPSS